jgi:hypothetical protein
VYFRPIARHIFLMFEGKNDSSLGRLVQVVMVVAIVCGLVSMIMSTDPVHMSPPHTCSKPVCFNTTLCPDEKICAPVAHAGFQFTNNVVTVIFIVDYFIRLLTVWAVNPREADILPHDWDKNFGLDEPLPEYSTPMHILRFILQIRNLIDLCAIIPYFISAANPGVHLNNNYIRVLRLVRVFGLMNRQPEVQVMLGLILETMQKSSYALGVLLLVSLVFVVFFGSVVFALESGTFTVNADYPTGALLRSAYNPSDGVSVPMATPFDSIGTSMYYVVTTITTVGYGDLFPTTFVGRLCANVIMYVGIIGLALPIGVISSNFAELYKAHFTEKAAEEAAAAAAEEASNKSNDEYNNNTVPVQKYVAQDDAIKRLEEKMNAAQGSAVEPIKPGSMAQSFISLQSRVRRLKDIRNRWEKVMKEIENLVL